LSISKDIPAFRSTILSPFHEPHLHPLLVNIFTLSISFHPSPKSHIIFSSNQMYIMKLVQYSFARESAFGTDLCTSQ